MAALVLAPTRVSVVDSEVSDNGGPGVDATSKVRVRRSVISANGAQGAISTKIRVVDSELIGNGGTGIDGGKGLVSRSNVSGNGEHGVHGNVRKVKDSIITGNAADGVHVITIRPIRITGTELSNNGGAGLYSVINGQIKLKESTITDNAAEGVFASHSFKGLLVQDCVVAGNGLHGVAASDVALLGPCQLKVLNSNVSANGTDSSCGTSQTCGDLASCELPEVAGATTCDTSYDLASGFPGESWGICAFD